MKKEIFIVTGCSSGIGKEICQQLLNKNFFVLGISKSKIKINSNNFFFMKHNFSKLDIIYKKKYYSLLNNKKINLILNAGINFDKNKKITPENMKKILNVNFFSQFYFFLSFLTVKDFFLKKVMFISSYDVFSKKPSQFFGYSLSKNLIFETYRLMNTYNVKFKTDSKLAFLGACDTKMYRKSNKKKYVLNKNKILTPVNAAESLLKFMFSKKKVTFIPNKKNNLGISLYIKKIKRLIN